MPLQRIARQSIEFPPYLVTAPAEWKEKVPQLWGKIKERFGVEDCNEAGGKQQTTLWPLCFRNTR